MEQVETANAYRKYFTMYFVYTYGCFSAQPSLQDFAQVILEIFSDQEVSKFISSRYLMELLLIALMKEDLY